MVVLLQSFQRYRIKEFEKPNTPNDIYDIPKGATFETNPAGQACSHCVVIVGYGRTSDGLSYYIFQNSYGKKWGDDGFGRVACSCLEYLYRASV